MMMIATSIWDLEIIEEKEIKTKIIFSISSLYMK